MEIFLNLWDELDDVAGTCRHIATGWLWSLKNLI
jgi:hypothetical protein